MNDAKSVSAEVESARQAVIDTGCSCDAMNGYNCGLHSALATYTRLLWALMESMKREARKEALEEAARVANTTPFRAHRDDDVNFHSGCVQTRERIVDAIRNLAAASKVAGGG